MGKILHFGSSKKEGGASRNLKHFKNLIDSDGQNQPNVHAIIKYFYLLEGADKFVKCFSVSSWLSTRKRGSKHRLNGHKKHKLK